MSKSVNKVILLGNVGRVETRTLSGSGTLLTTISLATNDRFKKGEDWQERVDWHNVLCYARLGEIARDYLRKGSKLYVEGRIRNDSWDDKDTGQKRYRTYVVASELSLLDSRERQGDAPDEVFNDHAPSGKRYESGAADPNSGQITDEDIPF